MGLDDRIQVLETACVAAVLGVRQIRDRLPVALNSIMRIMNRTFRDVDSIVGLVQREAGCTRTSSVSRRGCSVHVGRDIIVVHPNHGGGGRSYDVSVANLYRAESSLTIGRV